MNTLQRPTVRQLNTVYGSLRGESHGPALAGLFAAEHEDAATTKARTFDLQVATERLHAQQARARAAPQSREPFGTFEGVFSRCLVRCHDNGARPSPHAHAQLNVFGILMFVRIPWVVGQAGLVGATGIILV